MDHNSLANAGATPFETLWEQLVADKPSFIAKMREEQKSHDEKLRLIRGATMGNPEYMMMQLVWTEYHQYGGKRAPPPPPPPTNPHAGQFFLSPSANNIPNEWRQGGYSAQPALTQTPSHEQTVQWVQGNRIIMRPLNREVLPGERMSSVRIVR